MDELRKIYCNIKKCLNYAFKIQKGDSDEIPDKIKAEYKKRKLVEEVVTKHYTLTKGMVPDKYTKLF